MTIPTIPSAIPSIAFVAVLISADAIPLPSLGPLDLGKVASTGLAGVIFYFYHQGRKDMERVLSSYREIVEKNTEVLTKLNDKLDERDRKP